MAVDIDWTRGRSRAGSRFLAGEEAARKLTEYQTELRREKRREEREKGLRKTRRQRFAISTDVRHRGLQAFWAMHVEAMNWSGMGVRENAAALSLSPYALRTWRDRLDDGKVEIDWRAHLHPSARPVVRTSSKESVSESSLTVAANDVPQAPATPTRRFFSDEQKLAIVKETEQPGVTVSSVARKHGIVTGLLFRWRAQFGVAQKKRARLASVALVDDTAVTPLLRPPEGMMAVDLTRRALGLKGDRLCTRRFLRRRQRDTTIVPSARRRSNRGYVRAAGASEALRFKTFVRISSPDQSKTRLRRIFSRKINALENTELAGVGRC